MKRSRKEKRKNRRARKAEIRFHITDNLPDLSGRVYKEEIHLLLPVAKELLSCLTEDGMEDILPERKEVSEDESSSLRESLHHPSG